MHLDLFFEYFWFFSIDPLWKVLLTMVESSGFRPKEQMEYFDFRQRNSKYNDEIILNLLWKGSKL